MVGIPKLPQTYQTQVKNVAAQEAQPAVPTPEPTPPDGGNNSTSTKAESSSNDVLNYMANSAVYNQLSIANKKSQESEPRMIEEPLKRIVKGNTDSTWTWG